MRPCDKSQGDNCSRTFWPGANNAMLHTGSMLINLRAGHGNQQALMNRLRERVQQVDAHQRRSRRVQYQRDPEQP